MTELVVAIYNITIAEQGEYVPRWVLGSYRIFCYQNNYNDLTKRYDLILDDINKINIC